MYLATEAVSRAAKVHPGRKTLIIAGLLVIAAIGISLGIATRSPHHVTGYSTAQRATVTVSAPASTPQNLSALIVELTGVVSALAAVGSMGIAFAAWRRPGRATP